MPYVAPHDRHELDLEVVILNYNTAALLERCLESLLERAPRHRVLLTVVDNASTDGSRALLDDRFGSAVNVIASPINGGFAHGNNLALRLCRARHAFLLNSDATLLLDGAHALDALVDALDADPTIGALGPRVERPDGTIEESTGGSVALRRIVVDRLVRAARLPRRLAGLVSQSRWTYDRVRDVDWVSGAALAVRGDVLREGCLLDEGYFLYTEDVEWCHRVRRAGRRVVFTPHIVVRHIGHGSAPRDETLVERRILHRRGLLRFTTLHPSPWYAPLRALLRLSLALLERRADALRRRAPVATEPPEDIPNARRAERVTSASSTDA